MQRRLNLVITQQDFTFSSSKPTQMSQSHWYGVLGEGRLEKITGTFRLELHLGLILNSMNGKVKEVDSGKAKVLLFFLVKKYNYRITMYQIQK